ncbi:Stp1/IreP family PP2C-type Ser/Thr phosphatase [Senegalia massiliensis]|uniref:Stp1/IreP family PP2C-type Ser/Thr phosphatase n=1 Tax=Senegalia massiliensis TaxID=1720316 RepID=UPI00102FC74F|nr:Stp1/IreP family PP2C-type Ser/Thr phosphatase [Senegalia massiliensis]
MKYGACTDVGKVRKSNQDSYYINYNNSLPVFAVADGMGGHNGGEIASSITVEVIKNNVDIYLNRVMEEKYNIKKFIRKTLELSNEEIYNTAKKNKEYKGMGTTVTMGAIINDILYIGHIGDSRAYILRGDTLKKITEDHSLVAELLKKGSITKEEAINHPQKNIITRALGTDKNADIDIFSYCLEKNDVILFCTDGLTNMINEYEIKEIINNSSEIQEVCETLVNIANKNGGYDNSTAVIIKFVK